MVGFASTVPFSVFAIVRVSLGNPVVPGRQTFVCVLTRFEHRPGHHFGFHTGGNFESGSRGCKIEITKKNNRSLC